MTRYLAIFLSLVVAMVCDASEKTLLENITYEYVAPPGSGVGSRTFVHDGDKALKKIVAKYPSLEAFREELVRGWKSEDARVCEFALRFTWANFELLHLTQAEIDMLIEIAQDPESGGADTAVSCISQLKRKELIPIFIRLAIRSDAYVAASAYEALKENADLLTEADIVSLLPGLDDIRDIGLGGGDCYYTTPLSVFPLELIQTLGPRAACVREALLKKYVLKSCHETFDEKKFQEFVDTIQKPGANADEFQRTAEAAGLLEPCFERLAEQEWYDSTLQLAFVKAYCAVAPDDSIGPFLAMKWAIFPEKMESMSVCREYRFEDLGGPRKLLPVLDFLAVHPELCHSEDSSEDSDPLEIWWMAKIAALRTTSLTERECSERVLEVYEFCQEHEEYDFSSYELEDTLREYQRQHVPALRKRFPELDLEYYW